MKGKIIVIGNLSEGKWDSPQHGRVYSAEGISPCINTMCGGNLQPKIVVYETDESIRSIQDTEQ